MAILASTGLAADRLVPLTSDALCAKCTGYLLPGRLVPSPHTRWRIDSDLPEMFTSNGVLYTTKPVLPAFDSPLGEAPLALRTQRNIGFRGIDDSVEVFLYHFSQGEAAGEVRRIVVLAENVGEHPARVTPRHLSVPGRLMARVGSVESILGERVFNDDFDVMLPPVEIEPGGAGIIAFTKQLNAAEEGPDSTRAGFVNDTLRAQVEGISDDPDSMPLLHLTVLSIPGHLEYDGMLPAALALRDVGATSGERGVSTMTPPHFCAVRRVVGVAYNRMWESDVVEVDVSKLPPRGVEFPMALPAGQSVGCEAARQTTDLLLHPGYVHPDSIGNYQMEYLVRFALSNSGASDVPVDVRFGKKDQKIGLVWQADVGDAVRTLEEMGALPSRVNWAGYSSPEAGIEAPRYDASFLEDEAPLVIAPGQTSWVTVRFLILGTSSLPFDLILDRL